MTIGIGVLCSSQPRPHKIRPDGLILMADTMGSTDVDSTSELHKLGIEEDQKLYMACAGDVAICNDVGSVIKSHIAEIPRRTHGYLLEAINKGVHESLMGRFKWDVLNPKYIFSPGIIFEGQREPVTEEWQNYRPNFEMLVGTFHENGLALLYLVRRYDEGYGWVHLCQFPGHMAIGSGSYKAEYWLNFRSQQLGRNPKQSAYHAYEAKIMAESAPTVNKNTEIVVAFADRYYRLTNEFPEQEGCPFSLPELKALYPKYGPQNTDDLGHVKKSSSQKSAQVR